MTSPLATLDAGALERGMLLAALVAVPASLVGTAVVGDRGEDPSAWVWLFVVLVLAGLAAGAAEAARRQRAGTPVTHGIVAAVAVYLVVQAISVIRQAVVGDGVAWGQVLSSFLLSAMAGLVGGLLGGWAAARRLRRGAG